MRMTFRGGDAKGIVYPPASKSHTHRAFFLGAMADGVSEISNPLMADDTMSTLKACEAMGAEVDIGDAVRIKGGNLRAPSHEIDAGNSGTTLRILTGLLSMFDTECTVTGDASLKTRPMGPLLDALRLMGVECTSADNRPPVTVKGPNRGGSTEIDGSKSSQFVTSLLMVSPMLDEDSSISIRGKLVSKPYIDVTVSMMRDFGATVEEDRNHYKVRNTGYKPAKYAVPSDFSSAAFPLVAGALGGPITVKGMDLGDLSGDGRIIEILKQCGARVEAGDGEVTVSRGDIKPMNLDLGANPDLFPVTAVLLSAAVGTSRIYGAPQLRLKESDRIESTVAMLNDLGVMAEETDDGCVIHGKGVISGGEVDNRGDHRIMMAAAIASFASNNPIIMDDAECHGISYPGFIDDMRRVGMRMD